MKITKIILTISILLFIFLYSCKNKSEDPKPTDKCASKTISLTATLTSSSSCQTNGKIIARATGSSGFTFQLNSGTFQSDSVFGNLAAGTYTVTAKDVDGCTKSANFIVEDNAVKGPTYTAVAAIIATKCEGGFCHGTGAGGAPINIMNTDCKIVSRNAMIKIKAVDEGMGSLNTTDKNKITAWITAGGKLTD